MNVKALKKRKNEIVVIRCSDSEKEEGGDHDYASLTDEELFAMNPSDVIDRKSFLTPRQLKLFRLKYPKLVEGVTYVADESDL